ncbi:MFS transporter [Vibrio sp. VB16]|uniref:MFS transporter n=1 Tax=Vibrio sp. VB16 TaxID=2785746 RepID=UPI00189E30BD|nr:MFS transporter [Vibrio sp. VB16]UGA55654.1 MFS transporter [Vibrio sp. VB16]
MSELNPSPTSSSSLLTQRRFLPYFITQFFGAFNDNIFKNVLLILVAFTASGTLSISSSLFINIAAGLFILPFFLFSATAGELADKYDKDWFIRKVKLAEIGIMTLGAIGFITQSYEVLLLLLFLMGTQSAFFGPVKYALLPQHLKSEELLTGNALVETGTFLAILLGTLAAGIIASNDNATHVAALSVMLFSIIGYVSSRFIPKTPAANPTAKIRWQPIKQTRHTLGIAKKDSVTHKSILAISWFWFLGASYLTQFPNFTQISLHGSESAVSFLLALFSVGIAIGSQLCDKLSRNRIEYGLVPVGSMGITLFGILMAYSVPDNLPSLTSFADFVGYRELWPTFTYLALLGISGGLFIVPLYTVMQLRAKKTECSQVIAANNIYNALFMVGSAILGIVLLGILEMPIPEFFIFLSVINFVVVLYLFSQVPVYAVRFVVWIVTHIIYRVKHTNLHHLPKNGGALLVCNHVSYMDALLLSAVCPRLIRFVMEEDYANLKPLRRFLFRAGVIPVSAANSRSIRKAFKEVEKALSDGEIVCIFPEGRLTEDGEIQPFMRGIDIIINRSPVPVIPLAIKGMWGSYFSRHKGRAFKGFPNRFRAKLEIEAGRPVSPADAKSDYMREQVQKLRGSYK